jgi:NTP pyrophosphatase (non-canonical NTP hydrolase)
LKEHDVDQLLTRLRKFRDDRDWSRFHTPKDLAIAISIEANELLENFQWRPEGQGPDAELIRSVKEEAADVFIYLALLSDALQINLLEAANEKIDLNERRFPVESSRGVAKPEDRSSMS